MLTRRNIFLVLATTTFIALSRPNHGGGGGGVHAFVLSPAVRLVSPFVSTTTTTTTGKVGTCASIAPVRSTVDLPVRILVSPLHSTSAPTAVTTTSATTSTTTLTPPVTTSATKQPLPPLTSLGNRRLAVSMAFLTGWADIALNARVATFCTMMSGNTLWFGRSLIQRKPLDGVYYLSVIAAYILGLAAYHKEKRRDPSSSILLQTAKVTIPMFVLADYLLKRACWIQTAGISAISSIPVRARFAPALLLSFAFAWVNSIGTDIAGQATSVITGHMTRCTNQFMDNFTPSAVTTDGGDATATPVPSFWERLAKRSPFWTSLYVILGFGGGATWANFLKANPQWWMHQPNTMGDFAWIGVCFGVMFWWKEQVARPKGE